jgi:uncharacterized protein YuzE
MSAVKLEVQHEFNLAYLYLVEPEVERASVARTVGIDELIAIDLDADERPLGVELLGQCEIPELKLLSFRIPQADIDELKRVAKTLDEVQFGEPIYADR